jgi:hypothetical protein
MGFARVTLSFSIETETFYEFLQNGDPLSFQAVDKQGNEENVTIEMLSEHSIAKKCHTFISWLKYQGRYLKANICVDTDTSSDESVGAARFNVHPDDNWSESVDTRIESQHFE